MRKNNINELIWFLILCVLAVYMSFLVVSGKITYFIHPRLIKYIVISIVFIIVLAVHQFRSVLKHKHRAKLKKGFLLFLVPLLLGITVKSEGLNSGIAVKEGFNKSSQGSFAKKSNVIDYFSNGTITFNDDEYVTILNDISSNKKKYNGTNIVINGFVYRDKSFKKNEFVAARFLMVCCAADTSIVGLMGKWDKAPSLKNGDWVSAHGKLKYRMIYDNDSKQNILTPTIDVSNVTKIQKPDNEYVYP